MVQERRRTLPVFAHRFLRAAVDSSYRLPGSWRLRHWVMNWEQVRFPEDAISARLVCGPQIWVRPNDPIGRSIFYFGAWEKQLLELFLASIRLGDVVLDVGANVGQFALAAASVIGGHGKVFAVEPGSEAVRLLTRSLEANSYNSVTLLPMAAWDSETTLVLDGIREDMLGWGNVHASHSPLQSGGVPARRLDVVLPEHGVTSVQVIKIDVEGAELPALRGMEGLLRNSPPRAIFCEVSNTHEHNTSDPKDVIAFFEERGYSPWEIVDGPVRPFDRTKLNAPYIETLLFSRSDPRTGASS